MSASEDAPAGRGTHRDRIAGAVLAAVGLAAGLEAMTFDVAFMTDPVGPKALPMLVAITLILAGAGMIVRPRPDVDVPPRDTVLRMGLAGLSFLAYALLLPWLGFFLSTSLVVTTLGVLFRRTPRGESHRRRLTIRRPLAALRRRSGAAPPDR